MFVDNFEEVMGLLVDVRLKPQKTMKRIKQLTENRSEGVDSHILCRGPVVVSGMAYGTVKKSNVAESVSSRASPRGKSKSCQQTG